MDESAILEQLTESFREVFEDNSLVVHRKMTAKEVAKWDSLSQIDMIALVEERFAIKITTREVMALDNVEDLIRVIQSKKA